MIAQNAHSPSSFQTGPQSPQGFLITIETTCPPTPIARRNSRAEDYFYSRQSNRFPSRGNEIGDVVSHNRQEFRAAREKNLNYLRTFDPVERMIMMSGAITTVKNFSAKSARLATLGNLGMLVKKICMELVQSCPKFVTHVMRPSPWNVS